MIEYEKIFSDVVRIIPSLNEDDRGFFSEIYNKNSILDAGVSDNFVQDNLSFSKNIGTIRGLHFQRKPKEQSKLIRVIEGKIFDVFIDLREKSKDFERHGSCIIKPTDGWVYIPRGFAHGFCTLTDNVTVLYKVDNYYSKEYDSGIIWNDSTFNINWPIDHLDTQISEKDKNLPPWNQIKSEASF